MCVGIRKKAKKDGWKSVYPGAAVRGSSISGEERMSCYLPLVHRWRKPRVLSDNNNKNKNKRDKKKEKEEERAVEYGRRDTHYPDPLLEADVVGEFVGEVGSGRVLVTRDQVGSSHVRATRDQAGVTLSQGMGDFPRQVFLNIRHDHPTLGLDDVAYQRLHQEHTHHSAPAGGGRRFRGGGNGGVVSLGLPLGISSLKLSSKPRKVKNRRSKGHMSDGDLDPPPSSRRARHPTASTPITPRTPSFGPVEYNESPVDVGKAYYSPPERRSSLPRKSKMPTVSAQQLEYIRPLSVDADLLLQSARRHTASPAATSLHHLGEQSSHGGSRYSGFGGHSSAAAAAAVERRFNQRASERDEQEEQAGFVHGSKFSVRDNNGAATLDDEQLQAGSRFAHLTSTHRFMSSQGHPGASPVDSKHSLLLAAAGQHGGGEKSSSGNSSGSDLTWEGSPPPPDLHHACSASPPPSLRHLSAPPSPRQTATPSPLHPALRGRAVPEVAVATRGPPPAHLLPKKLRPSPLTKLHPRVVLTPQLRKGRQTGISVRLHFLEPAFCMIIIYTNNCVRPAMMMPCKIDLLFIYKFIKLVLVSIKLVFESTAF